MPSHPEAEQRDLVRERFTRTADEFASFALATRTQEATWLADLITPTGNELALDVACGPGTFAIVFAARVQHITGLDLTPALLERARLAAAEAALQNITFLHGDATALPFPDGAFDLVLTAYSLHHMTNPQAALREMSRVVRRGGTLAIADLAAPEEPDRAAANNTIERARDASHTTTLRPSQFAQMLEATGLETRLWQFPQRLRSFDNWMHVAGWKRGDPAYEEARRLMEASMLHDTAGFHPRLVAADIEWVQTSAFYVTEKK